jgi:hypothetical protein
MERMFSCGHGHRTISTYCELAGRDGWMQARWPERASSFRGGAERAPMKQGGIGDGQPRGQWANRRRGGEERGAMISLRKRGKKSHQQRLRPLTDCNGRWPDPGAVRVLWLR